MTAEEIEARSEPIPESGCWIWMGRWGKNGYGTHEQGNRREYAHRSSWKMYRGPIPVGLSVLHSCDTPPCVNPAHLFLGTDADNGRDRDQKGRHGYRRHLGVEHGMARLTDDTVREIRARYAAGETQVALSREYGVRQTQISNVVLRRSWAHVL